MLVDTLATLYPKESDDNLPRGYRSGMAAEITSERRCERTTCNCDISRSRRRRTIAFRTHADRGHLRQGTAFLPSMEQTYAIHKGCCDGAGSSARAYRSRSSN